MTKPRPLISLVFTACLILGLPFVASAQSWSFATFPSDGRIEGAPGATIGWGFSLANQSQDKWLWAYFVETDSPFLHATIVQPPIFDSVLAPGSTAQVDWGQEAGLMSIKLDNDAPVGFTNRGRFRVISAWYDADPYSGGNYLDDAGDRSASYTAVVTAVPEPNGLCALGLGGLFLWRRGNKR